MHHDYSIAYQAFREPSVGKVGGESPEVHYGIILPVEFRRGSKVKAGL